MRTEPYSIGSYLHTIKRGARGMNVVRNKSDMWHFLRALYYMNDEYINWDWKKLTRGKGVFFRPHDWPERRPLVHILCYTLMPNHIHLLLKEIREGGTSLFMKKLGQSMTEYANRKYKEKGSLFQGSYRSKTIKTDAYLERVAAYIMVKNTFELYPNNGLRGAQRNFEHAWKWGLQYPFSSLANYAGMRDASPIITKGILGKIFNTTKTFKAYSRDVLMSGTWGKEEFE